jgi:hypothetical protein
MIVEIETRIERFKAELCTDAAETLVQRHVTFGEPFAIHRDQYFNLKSDVAAQFKLNPRDIVMVGSGKLGFSIVANKRYRHFGESSDIDLAIINSQLFDEFWDAVFDYRHEVGYWEKETDFARYLFRGWIRPDLLPPSERFQRREDWWRFFQSLSATGKYGPYKITAGLYRTMRFLERYQTICVNDCRSELEMSR